MALVGETNMTMGFAVCQVPEPTAPRGATVPLAGLAAGRAGASPEDSRAAVPYSHSPGKTKGVLDPWGLPGGGKEWWPGLILGG